MNLDYTGHEYEHACAKKLKKQGFTNVQVTKGSGDQGIDVIAHKNGKKYGIQCKYYSSPVGNHAVQEAYAGAKYYGCDYAVVMTNTTFTKSANELAKRIGVQLWENNKIDESSSISCLGCFGITVLFLLIVGLIADHKTRIPFLIIVAFIIVFCVMMKKRKTHKKTETIDEINKQIDETMIYWGNIYLNLFKERYFVDVKLVETRMVNNTTNEFIYSVETEEQAKYLLTKETEMNTNLKEIYTFTLLANNHISLLVETIKNQ